jgi:hypothetical protein
MRRLRGPAILGFGVVAGFAAAAAIVRRALPSHGDEESDEVALVAIFDGIELRSRSQAFRGGTMLSWFGGIAVDLREAELAPNAAIRVHALLGGIAIRVPRGCRIESSVRGLAGGVAVHEPATHGEAPTLALSGFSLLGGIAVGAPPTASD